MPLLFIDFTWLSEVRKFDIKNLEDLSYVPSWDSYQFYDEIDSGSAYHCFQQKISEKKDAVQVPLVFFSDGTVVDKQDIIPLIHLCLHLAYSSKVWEGNQ